MAATLHVESVLDALLALMHEFRLCDEVAERMFRVSAAQLAVLAVVSRNGTLSVQRLASTLHLHQSSASGIVRKLAQHGLVDMSIAEADRRSAAITLTRRGQALADKVGPTGRPLFRSALSGLDDRSAREVQQSLQLLREAMADRRLAAARKS